MVKTFEELAKELFKELHVKGNQYNVIEDLTIPLMKLVRLKTLEECANKADADYNIVCADDRVEYTINGEVEVYVLKESILQLSKDSIEI